MHLKAITIKGFKSFPDRTTLTFGPGVSVVVGPNGSGKSNITDAVLWVLGEQSPLAVRGQTMQDVIFSGGRGTQARSAAEVELILDNADGTLGLPVSEVSISRRLDRSGEGEYRLNGARCRLLDVIEILSDTGLGKEMHTVISQGRVESIVTSKPRDRRLLIEEAAGLGKHRKRRRRAQLKLERTRDNLDRALDVEREARSRLRPLKRQAEAAELHERLERQSDEARWELARDELRAARESLAEAEQAAAGARSARDATEAKIADVARRREAAEDALTQRSELREALSGRAFAARRAQERLELRRDQALAAATASRERLARREQELERLPQADDAHADPSLQQRIGELEQEINALDDQRASELDRELASLNAERDAAASRAAALATEVEAARAALARADEAAEAGRIARRDAEAAVETARRRSAATAAELAACRQFLAAHAGTETEPESRTLARALEVESGYELALAAALGERLDVPIAGDRRAAGALLDAGAQQGGRVLVAGSPAGAGSASPPTADARPLLSLVRGAGHAEALATVLLADAWVVERLDDVEDSFGGIAVTSAGRVWVGALRELRQHAAGGAERLLAERNRQEDLVARAESDTELEAQARHAVERGQAELDAADTAREEADLALRVVDRARAEAVEAESRCAWLLDQRRAAPAHGPEAVRRAQLEGELAAERRMAERFEQERRQADERRRWLEAAITADGDLGGLADRLAEALDAAKDAAGVEAQRLEAELSDDRSAGLEITDELRACAAAEAELQSGLHAEVETLTGAEVRAQQMRDQSAERQAELVEVAARLGLASEPADEALDDERLEALRVRIERLGRRRAALGPVNPLAHDEYADAVEHVEELERHRTDLETAMRELGSLIRDTDRQIRETFEQTFEAAARNFEDLVAHAFPGGRGRLRLVSEDATPRALLGGAAAEDGGESVAPEDEGDDGDEEDRLGVEIEVTPAGKATRRLSLLSGGEKAMTAIAFLFAVFLARPCPFYILDEVEAALDDLNIDRFLTLLRRYSERAQFIVITHQRRTMEAADTLYGVSMGDDGISKVISRRLPPPEWDERAGETPPAVATAAGAEAAA
ncbi:MAG: chromosome segregation protein [Solirubrobacteraceae bacterium]|nr:chromosome segregation protein [Solirubrobacteraceae bacterium]